MDILHNYRGASFIYLNPNEATRLHRYFGWSEYIFKLQDEAFRSPAMNLLQSLSLGIYTGTGGLLTPTDSERSRRMLRDSYCRWAVVPGLPGVIIGISSHFSNYFTYLDSIGFQNACSTLNRRLPQRLANPEKDYTEDYDLVIAILTFIQPSTRPSRNSGLASVINTCRVFDTFCTQENNNYSNLKPTVVNWLERFSTTRRGIRPEWLANYLRVKDIYDYKEETKTDA